MVENENIIRFLAFFCALVIFLLWEAIHPRKKKANDYALRCLNNLSLIALSSLLIRFCFPVLALSSIAWQSTQSHWGLMHALAMHDFMKTIVCIVLLDFIIYIQHVATHHIPFLWRLHRLHHSDPELNVTTGVRFHPLEIVFSLMVKATAIISLGIPVMAVIVFELILNTASLFNHANIYIPKPIDYCMRYFFVTPDMHRIHHSSHVVETDSNYGFCLSCWDRLFHTYKAEPELGYDNILIGLNNFKQSETLWLHRLVIQPFINPFK